MTRNFLLLQSYEATALSPSENYSLRMSWKTSNYRVLVG